jgi:hypothetical protein
MNAFIKTIGLTPEQYSTLSETINIMTTPYKESYSECEEAMVATYTADMMALFGISNVLEIQSYVNHTISLIDNNGPTICNVLNDIVTSVFNDDIYLLLKILQLLNSTYS